MNLLQQVMAFALVHANFDDREDLTSKDVLAGIYILAAERLHAESLTLYTVDKFIRELCGITEPLWFTRMRYFAELYLGGSGIRAYTAGDSRFGQLSNDPTLLSSEDPVKAAFLKLRSIDTNLDESLRQVGISLE